MNIRSASTRGRSQTGWLDSRHSFSFGSYRDPARMGTSVLRVINDDLVQPASGFATHGHRDMEILSYVTRGVMQHRDSTGQTGEIGAGEFQLMSAGSGILHSEHNASDEHALAFLQIWIEPQSLGGVPRYQQQAFPRQRGLQQIAAPDGPLQLRQDAWVLRLIAAAGEHQSLTLASGRVGYLHVVQGRMAFGGMELEAGDAAEVEATDALLVSTLTAVEALWFDLPGRS